MKLTVATLPLALLRLAAHGGSAYGENLHPRQSPGLNVSVTTVLENLSERYILPGLAAFAKGGEYFKAEAVGIRKYGDETPLQITDDFHLGSNTKAMTMTLITILAEHGLISWESTIGEAAPQLAAKIPSQLHDITVRMLGAHRSGLDSSPYLTLDFLTSLQNESLTAVAGRQYALEYVLNRPQNRTRGLYLYDNYNYLVLGAMIDHLDCSWEDSITRRLFGPLKMTCGFGPTPLSSPSSTTADNTWPHFRNTSKSPPEPNTLPFRLRDNPPLLGPAGTVHCDPASYARFLQLHIDGGRGLTTQANGQLNISAASFATLHTPYPPGNASDILYTPGGWDFLNSTTEREWAGGYTLTHTGNNRGNYAYAVIAPFFEKRPGARTPGLAVAALTNIGDPLVETGEFPSFVATRSASLAMVLDTEG